MQIRKQEILFLPLLPRGDATHISTEHSLSSLPSIHLSWIKLVLPLC